MLGFQVFCMLMATIECSVVLAKFKTLSCESFDKQYGDFTHCQIKAINRNKNVVNINYLQKVITNHLVVRWISNIYLYISLFFVVSQIQLEFFKRANGWHPFLYNFKFDLCRFLKKNYNILLRMGYNYLKNFTNLNHSCPLSVSNVWKYI